MESFFSCQALSSYRALSKASLVNDFTDTMPERDSSTITLLAAVVSCSSLDFFLRNRPKTSATMMIAGRVASIKIANLVEVMNRTTTPPMRTKICLRNIAKLVVNAS